MKSALLLVIYLFIFNQLQAQTQTGILSKNETDSLISGYCKVLNETYFDKSAAKEISKTLQKKLKAGEFYKKENLTDHLSLLLREITSDNHFYIGVAPTQTTEPTVNEQPETNEHVSNNGGFSEVKIIDINIGYIKWNEFIADDVSFQKAITALEFVKGCKQLVFDVSECPGGDGRIGAFINCHLFESNDYQNILRKKCSGESEWHSSEVPYNYTNGPKFYDIPIYVIVSKNTASSAEYFALIIKEMNRGIILGDTTAGAGNPSTIVPFGKYFAMIPICQIETASGKSIEGKGVIPDVQLTTQDRIKETIDYIKTHK
jgi:Peptidase family S41